MKLTPARLGIALAAILLHPGASLAQQTAASDTGEGLQEVVVTSQRREENLSNVPLSVAVFDQQQMDQAGIRNVDDLTRETPGLTFVRNGSANSFNDEQSNISIRGIFSSAGAATTGLYIDDTPVQTRHLSFGTVDPYPVLFDLDRVEVLRGPQGTLFGAGSEGGTVRFIRPEPDLTTFSSYDRAEFGQIDHGGQDYEVGSAFGGPIITDTLGFRISAFYREEGGWVDRVNYTTVPGPVNPLPVATGTTQANANWRDTYAANLALKWVPVEGLTISPSVFAQSLHINDTAMYWSALSSPPAGLYRNGNQLRDASTDPFYLLTLKVQWALPFADLVSNTSYFNRHEHGLTDYTQWVNTLYFNNPFPSPANWVSGYNEDDQNNLSEEIRISSKDPNSRLSWTGGIFLAHVSENQPAVITSPGVAALLGFPSMNTVELQPNFSILDKQAAAFGEVGLGITDSLKATAGVRVAHLQYSGVIQQSGPLLGGVVVASANSASENPVTPRFVLSYGHDENSLYYASAAKGYRPGGLNAALPALCQGDLPLPVPPTFQSDSLWQYELGSKQTLLDRNLQLNASVYYLKWKNIQQLVYLACGVGFTPNLGEVRGLGGDLEMRYRASSDLTLGLTAAYTDAYYTGTVSFANAGQSVDLVTSGDHLPASPWNVDVESEYVFNAIAWKPYLRIDYQLATGQKSLTQAIDPANTGSDPTIFGLPGIRVLSLRAGLRFNGFDMSLFAQNALNYNHEIFDYRDSQSPQDTNYMQRGIAPRTVGVTMTYHY